MKNLLILLALTSIFTACSSEKEVEVKEVESKTMATPEVKKVESKAMVTPEVKIEVVEKVKKEVVEQEKAEVVEQGKTGAELYSSCISCHGIDASKKALNKSAIIKTWNAKKIEDALLGYKNGTYGGAMKGIMKGQVIKLNLNEIKKLSIYIEKL